MANFNGQHVYYSESGNSIWIPIPDEIAEPIDGGCDCDWCKAHPDRVPKWDAICIARNPDDKARNVGGIITTRAHTVHYPELSRMD